MFVKVKDLVFPIDFIVLAMDGDVDFLIILGRPFLRISRALIDMEKGKLVLGVEGE